MRTQDRWPAAARRALAEQAGGLRDALDGLAARLREQLALIFGAAAAGAAARAVRALLGGPPDDSPRRPPSSRGRWHGPYEPGWRPDWADEDPGAARPPYDR